MRIDRFPRQHETTSAFAGMSPHSGVMQGAPGFAGGAPAALIPQAEEGWFYGESDPEKGKRPGLLLVLPVSGLPFLGLSEEAG